MKADEVTGRSQSEGFYIKTFTGKKFFWNKIEENEFDIHDIAHALSLNCRWTGHVHKFYSVAQHSLHVATMLPQQHKLAGLLHDASEAYVHDTPSPLKWYLEQHKFTAFTDLDERIDTAIYKKYGLEYPRHALVKEADMRMLATEARDLMGGDLRIPAEPYDWKIKPLPPERVEQWFLRMFNQLTEGKTYE